MYSIVTTDKLDNLKEAFEAGLLDDSMLEEFLEQINHYNCGLYAQLHKSRWKTPESIRVSYLASFPSWKDFDEYVIETSLDLIDQPLREHFKILKKLFMSMPVCKKVIQMYNFTQSPVYVTFDELKSVKYVLENIFELKYYTSDFRVK